MQNNSLVEENLGLVRKMAYEYACKSNLEYDDLFQEGVLGLIRASEKFDPEMGNAFSTYATWWIKQKMQRYVESNLNVSRVAKKNRGKIYATRREIEETGVTATPEMIAEKLGLKVSDVIGVLYPENVSLYAPIGDSDDDGCLIDTLAVDEEPLGKNIEKEEVAIMVRQAIATLKPRERDVIFERYFSNPGIIVTYDEISLKLGVSKQRIQQIEKRALGKLKHTKSLLEYSRTMQD